MYFKKKLWVEVLTTTIFHLAYSFHQSRTTPFLRSPLLPFSHFLWNYFLYKNTRVFFFLLLLSAMEQVKLYKNCIHN